jgi:hypothetical protein
VRSTIEQQRSELVNNTYAAGSLKYQIREIAEPSLREDNSNNNTLPGSRERALTFNVDITHK